MAGKHKNVHYLLKPIPGGKLFWKIEIRKNATFTTAGKVGSEPHVDPPEEHESNLAAYKYCLQQIKLKKRHGYREEGDPQERAPRESNVKKRSSREKRTMVDSVRKAAARAMLMAKGKNTYDSDSDTDDTMSLSSSASIPTHVQNDKLVGVSPLNRRRSLRLQLKQESVMDTLPLKSQDTVEMLSPPVVKRMDTSTRWTLTREKRNLSKQDTLIEINSRKQPKSSTKPRLPKGLSKWVEYRNEVKSQPTLTELSSRKRPSLESSESDSDISKLLKKQSTTFGLRHMLASTGLSDHSPQPADEVQGGVMPESALTRPGRPKRKASVLSPASPDKNVGAMPRLNKTVTVLSTISEGDSRDGFDEVDSGAQSASNHSRLKRQTSRQQSQQGHPKTKRKRAALHRRESIICGGAIYIPPKEEWPVNLPAQVVWGVPTKNAQNESVHALGVYVEPRRCLIGLETGKIIELDETASPSHIYQLHAGVKCIIEDEDFVYAGCDDGGLYDITHGDPRLVCHCKEFGQLFALDVYYGMLAASDQHGNVALIDHSGAVIWRKKSKGEFGWMVKMDDTGIFHGHTAGVTKYSILTGEVVWHLDTKENVLYGVQTEPFIYAATGNKVIKIDKNTGNILKIYNKGKTAHRIVQSNAVAGGLVFAGGNKIVCYDEETGDVVYTMNHQLKPASMQYFQGRLFCVGKGALTVLDFTEEVIKKAQSGEFVTTVEVTPDPSAPVFTPLKRVETISEEHKGEEGVLVQCVKPKARKGKLVVRAMSKGFNSTWDVQFPTGLCSEGTNFLVQELRPSKSGNFYRVFGEIKHIDGSS